MLSDDINARDTNFIFKDTNISRLHNISLKPSYLSLQISIMFQIFDQKLGLLCLNKKSRNSVFAIANKGN